GTLAGEWTVPRPGDAAPAHRCDRRAGARKKPALAQESLAGITGALCFLACLCAQESPMAEIPVSDVSRNNGSAFFLCLPNRREHAQNVARLDARSLQPTWAARCRTWQNLSEKLNVFKGAKYRSTVVAP